MSTMTTTVRGTPSLTVAPTQNTAPVFEFRCLYTHDVRKKKKIWHDGSLRFHTFNRRVMVYDDSKNYIGDAHWRETGDFLEGEELRLDKGVIVEVGEQIGHTETDLAPIILEKRRPELASSPPHMPVPSNAYSSGPRTAGIISQARPKSLAAVLGASQGPIGRARLPVRSPFERRQDNIQRPPETCEGRPAKRPRTAAEKAGKENRVHNATPVRQVHLPAAQASRATKDLRNLPSPRGRTSLVPNKLLGNTAGSITRPSPAPLRHGSKQNGRSQYEALSVAESIQPPSPSTSNRTARFAQKAVGDGVASATASGDTSKQQASAGRRAVQSKKTNHTKVFAGNSAPSTGSLGGTVTAKLRFTNEKPRKKLMYKDLLPKVGQGKMLSRTNGNGNVRKREDKGNKGRAAENSRSSGNPLHRESLIIDLLSGNEGKQTPVPRNMVRTYHETLSPSPSALPSPSPMFVNESPLSAGLTPSQRSFDEDFEPPARPRSPSQKSVGCDRIGVSQRSQGDSPRDVTDLGDCPAADDVDTVADAIPQAPSEPTLLDQRRLQNSAEGEFRSETCLLQQPPKQRACRRIRSEGDSHVGRRTEANPTEIRRDAADRTTTCVAQALNQPQKPFRNPTKVQRSVSDVGHLARRTEVPAKGAPITPAVEACFEPWSEPEAYLLFDWWPPGKKKPSFVMSEP